MRVFSFLFALGGGGAGGACSRSASFRGLLVLQVLFRGRRTGHLACLDWWKFNDRIRNSRGRVRADPTGQK